MKKPGQYIVLGLISIFVLSGCDDEIGGGAGNFDTVTAIASVSTTDLDSDVATWTDGDSDGFVCGDNDTFTVDPDDVSVDITVDAKTNLPSTIEASKIRVDKVTITYTPANVSTPSISTQYETLGVVIDPDGSATISVRVASQELKASNVLSPLICTGTIYTYFVTLTFEGVEIDSNESENFDTTLNVRFADFVEATQ